MGIEGADLNNTIKSYYGNGQRRISAERGRASLNCRPEFQSAIAQPDTYVVHSGDDCQVRQGSKQGAGRTPERRITCDGKTCVGVFDLDVCITITR